MKIFRPLRLDQYSNLKCSISHFNQHKLYELYWIEKGKGQLIIDLNKLEITNNMMYLILPGQIQKLEAEADTELIGYKIKFSENSLSNSYESTKVSSFSHSLELNKNLNSVYLNTEAQQEIKDIFETIFLEHTNNNLFKNDIIQGLLTLLISYFPLSKPSKECVKQNSHDNAIFAKFIHKVEEQYFYNKNVSYYASELALTSGHLTELVKKISGYSPRHHIRQRVLLEAKRKAISSNKSAKQISFDLGFDDPAMFSKYFKNFAGSNFTDFRTRLS